MYGDQLRAALAAPDPTGPLWALVGAPATDQYFPELSALAMDDPAGLHKDVLAHSITVTAKVPARPTLRLAALCHDIGKPATRRIDGRTVTFVHHETVGADLLRTRLPQLGFDQDVVGQVATIVAMSGRFKNFDGSWTDAAVRRYVRDAGDTLEDLLTLSAEDVTSRHQWKHDRQHAQVAALRERIASVAEADRRAAERPPLDGRQVMRHTGLAPGPQVGELLARLLDAQWAQDQPLTQADAYALLDQWTSPEK